MVEKRSELDSVTKALQAYESTIADVRVIFYEIIEKYPNTARLINPNA